MNAPLDDAVGCWLVDRIDRTVKIESSTVEIEERGVKLRLTVVDTPGYSDAVNCQNWYTIAHRYSRHKIGYFRANLSTVTTAQ